MTHRRKVADIELTEPIASLAGLDGYASAQLLVRYDGTPLGYVTVPVFGGHCDAGDIATSIRAELVMPWLRELAYRRLATPLASSLPQITELLAASHESAPSLRPTISVAVCTRNRPGELALCLDSLAALDDPPFEILVIDNAPSDDATERLVRERFGHVRYLRELRPGLDWARNRAIEESAGEIIAFTDDDVIVDRLWTRALARVFASAPNAWAVTGLVAPFELETEAQQQFEAYGGFGRGFERKWHRAGSHHGAGRFGTGANMAFRRSAFRAIGVFDPALDVGTPTDGGGDLEMFFRLLQEGGTLVYEPRAIVRHSHRPDSQRLYKQIHDWGKGLFSYMRRSATAYPGERAAFRRLRRWWFGRYIIRRYLGTIVNGAAYPRALILAEVRGAWSARRAYREARRNAAVLLREHGPVDSRTRSGARPVLQRAVMEGIGVRSLELTAPFKPVDDVSSFFEVRLYLTLHGKPIGSATITNCGDSISVPELRDGVADAIARLLNKEAHFDILAHLERWLKRGAPAHQAAVHALAAQESVSVVVATYDRPAELEACLRCILAQVTDRPMEVLVVDNHPQSGLTAPVVARFPGVRLLAEPRQGLSFARNAGIAASGGRIVIATDDDVEMPADWLEKLVASFANPDVMIVTGNTLPFELRTLAEQRFEQYGGLGRGFSRVVVGRYWFDTFVREAVPTWQLGATANAAFRATIFTHPDIGMLDPALGAGTPTGCSEDTDLFYRVLAAGFTIVYEPDAFVWHHHRSDMRSLRRQIYNYSKGHVAYHLVTWQAHRDARALYDLVVRLPRWHAKTIVRRLLGRHDYPLVMTFTEIAGNLAGPWALWRSRRRVRRLGGDVNASPRE